jgi:hypothetical protein
VIAVYSHTMTTAIFQELEAEMKRANKIIADCETAPGISFVAIWLRALVRRGQQAIDDHDVVACIACLKQIREVKG